MQDLLQNKLEIVIFVHKGKQRKFILQKGMDYSNHINHRGQNSKQINIAKYIIEFLIYGAKMLDKCVKSQKIFFVHCPSLQS